MDTYGGDAPLPSSGRGFIVPELRNACAEVGRAANDCTTCFSGTKHKREMISPTCLVTLENSSDSCFGRRPKHESDEFSDVTKQVGEW